MYFSTLYFAMLVFAITSEAKYPRPPPNFQWEPFSPFTGAPVTFPILHRYWYHLKVMLFNTLLYDCYILGCPDSYFIIILFFSANSMVDLHYHITLAV